MGLFKVLLNGLGFKDEEEYYPQNVEVNTKSIKPKQEKFLQEGRISAVGSETKQVNVSNLVCYAPKSNGEVKLLIDCLKANEPCIVNLGGLGKAEIKSVLDYIGGAVYALGGTISRLQGDMYVLSPKTITVTTM